MHAQSTLRLVCFQLLVLGYAVQGVLFDFHVIDTLQNAQDGSRVCKALMYDGFAVLNSPESYNHALRISQALRKKKRIGMYVGLTYNSETDVIVWSDGTLPASDSPWAGKIGNPKFGFIRSAGALNLDNGFERRMALCGNHSKLPTETRGVTFLDQRPADVTSVLSVVKLGSYLECVLVCGQDHRCRTAEFQSGRRACTLLGPGGNSGLVASAGSRTFVREAFL
ncbi:hypothetical protein EGW08_017753 [Elysia chlorotica]|uniref:C-type lectin domain-containing protein n=1 Tax=Elysia chlorotica TaxID=188477 RepID=A0A433SYU4_ELYCH|nr:hypothetical protein EGW08_017753 [Elysia chlorotica]